MRTVAQDTAGADLVPIGSPWTRRLFDGEFYRSGDARLGSLPAVGLVVGRLPSGHVVTGEALIRATGVTSQHLIHEGLVRVDADAVRGSVADSLVARLRERPWIEVIDAGEPLSLFTAPMRLRTMGIQVVAAAGVGADAPAHGALRRPAAAATPAAVEGRVRRGPWCVLRAPGAAQRLRGRDAGGQLRRASRPRPAASIERDARIDVPSNPSAPTARAANREAGCAATTR